MNFQEYPKMANFFSRIDCIRQTCIVATLLRLVFMVYGEWQDVNMVVKYTDIDYEVFTDAARYVSAGKSPYNRPTYRYTPVVALLLVPNITLHKAFGKLLFVFCDIFAGYLIYTILSAENVDKKLAVKYSWLWFFNPMIVTVSTRGNAESLLAVLVLSTLYFMVKKRFNLSAIMLAFSVHFKIYPVIYALPLHLTVGWFARQKKAKSVPVGKQDGLGIFLDYFCHLEQFKFAVISGVTFLVLNGIMYYLYGFEFLEHTYLYHVTRKDVKHNFSVYFYLLYLTMDFSFSWVISLLAFLPQFLAVLVFGVKYYKDVTFCCFIQTFAFVTFNKVCTSQYFLWYLSLLPLIIPRIRLEVRTAVKMASFWFLSQALWLTNAYYLEFQGYNTFLLIWIASIIFFLVNIWILYNLIRNHKTPVVIKKNA